MLRHFLSVRLVVLCCAAVTASGLFVSTAAADSGQQMPALEWQTDFEVVRKIAQAEEKVILLFFTGSDWCSPCKELKSRVFDSPEFAHFAKEKIVTQYVDFPQFTKLKKATSEQNYTLATVYGVIANDMLQVPAVLLVSADGELLGRTGYMPYKAAGYIEHLQELSKGHLEVAALN